MKKLFALMLFVAAVVVTGCGDSATDTTPPATTDTTTDTTEEKPAEPAAP